MLCSWACHTSSFLPIICRVHLILHPTPPHPIPSNPLQAPQVIPSNFQIRGMHTIIRDRETSTPDFVFYSDRLLRLVVEASLGHLPFRCGGWARRGFEWTWVWCLGGQ